MGGSTALRPYVLPISAASEEGVALVAQSLRTQLARDELLAMSDLCYSAQRRRAHHDHRAALTFSDRSEALEQLEAIAAVEVHPRVARGKRAAAPERRLVFVFPGQGSQWLGMGRDLLRASPAARRSLEESDTAIRTEVGSSILQMVGDESAPEAQRIDDVPAAPLCASSGSRGRAR